MKKKLLYIFVVVCILILPFLYAGSGVVRPFITRFTSLVDTPSSFSGQASKIVAVNVGATAVEFVTESVFEDGGASEIAVTKGMMNTGTNASATTYWRGDNTWVTPSGSGDLLADGSVPLTANWDVGAFSLTALTFTSDQATGTAPFTVASTTQVANLNSATAGTAGVATTVTITDNESTAENNPIVFVAGGDLDGGNLGLESDGTAYYTPSTGKITTTGFVGALTGNADTVTTNANLTGDVTSTGNATDITESVLEDGGTDELAITAGMMNTGTNASAATYWRGDNTWVTPSGSGDLLADGSVPLTANWDVGAYTITGLTFVSDQATGTAPFTVASTTEVANLKAATATLADTATALATARAIGGVNFDGTAAITPTTIVVADTEDATAFVGLWDSATGSLLPKTDEQLTYAADTGILTAAGFAGPLTGNVTGNASGTAGVATTVTITDNESTAENNPIVFVAGADPDGGNLGLESDGTTHYNPSTGTITATEFVGGGVGLTGVTASHDGTITWTGTSILETGVAFQFGDGTDATLTHTYANTGTDVEIAYSTGAMAITGDLTATNLSGTNTGDNTVATSGDSATAFFSSGAVEVSYGGTGRSTGTTEYSLIATGTTATGAQQTLANGATTEILVGGGAAALPVWTTATGSGSPVRATSPTLVTPALGTPSALVGTNISGTAAGLTAGIASTVTVADESSDTTSFLLFTTAATGSLGGKTGAGLTVDASTDTLGATIVKTPNNIKDEPKHMIFTIIDPLATQTEDNEICLWPVTPAALTITKIVVTLDAAANEVAGDLKYADAFIGLANPVVINTFDTTSGVLADDSITSGTVASGKCIYISFDSAPNTAIHQMSVDITYDFD